MKAGTMKEFFEALVAHLNREPRDDQERQQIEAEKTAIRNAFLRMAGEEVEPEPLAPLSPGKARVVSF